MQALAGDGAVGDGEPLAGLRRAAAGAMAVAVEGPGRDEVGALQRVAGAMALDDAIALAMRAYDSAGAFGDAVYFARCLVRRPVETLRALAFRRYLEAAVVSSD